MLEVTNANINGADDNTTSTGANNSIAKKISKPYAKKGGPAHQKYIKEQALTLNYSALEDYEPTPNGAKRGRFIDVVERDYDGNPIAFFKSAGQIKVVLL